MEKEYLLPKEEYYETLWYIRRYPRFLQERNMILQGRGQSYGNPRGTEVGDPTAITAIKLEKVDIKIKPIKEALEMIPKEYQKGVLEAVIYRKRYPDYADTSTWKRWRRRFVYWVAIWRRNNEE